MNDNTSGIYVVSNLINGKKYVGQSYDLNRRLRTHKAKLKAGTHPNLHLQASWNKYGEYAFSFDVVEHCPVCELNEKEISWIEKLGTLSPGGYNMTLGGEGSRGYYWSDDAKKKLSEKLKNSACRYWQGKTLTREHKEKLRYAATHRSEETLKKIGEATRRSMSNPQIKEKMIRHQSNKAVYCIELDECFYSIGDAARKTGLSPGNISKVCRGLIKKTGGYHWKFSMPQEAHPQDDGR